MKICKVLLLLYGLLISFGAVALNGRVIAVSDGDTVTIADEMKVTYKIRLAGIDAPEKSQPYGEVAKKSLSDIVYLRDVRVKWDKKDRYGRIVGQIFLGQDDVSLLQIKAGMAWHYKAYQKEQRAEDQKSYAAAEFNAKASKKGLWADPNVIPPWQFRQQKKERILNK